jgi:ParB family transcriptional regulator, chromosome partitioning protein
LALTQEEVARRVGLNRATVTNHLRLLDLPVPVQEALGRGQLQMGHARALLGLQHAHERIELANRVVGEGLSVREVERVVREREEERRAREQGHANGGADGDRDSHAGAKGGAGSADGASATWVNALQVRLQEALGTKVELRSRPGYTGQIIVHYFDRDDLERLLDRLAPPHTI